MVRCGFCVRGECRHGDSCWRGSGGCVPPQQGPDSDYDTAESASEDGNADGSTDGSEGRSELGVIGAGELVPEQFAAREEAWLFERGGGRPQSAGEPVAICGQGSFGALAEGSEEEDVRRRDDQQPRGEELQVDVVGFRFVERLQERQLKADEELAWSQLLLEEDWGWGSGSESSDDEQMEH